MATYEIITSNRLCDIKTQINDLLSSDAAWELYGELIVTPKANSLYATYTQVCVKRRSQPNPADQFWHLFKEEISLIPGLGDAFDRAKERFDVQVAEHMSPYASSTR